MNNLSGFVVKTTEVLNITQIAKLIEYHPKKIPFRYLIISVITDSFVRCNDAIVAQCFVRFSIAGKSCGGTLANFNELNNHSCVTELKAFW